MSQQLYPQFRRTGAYTLFVDESEMGRTNTGDFALHLIVGQSSYGGAPINTITRIQDLVELENTFGPRNRVMERKGNYLFPMASVLLQQGPIYVLNLRTFDDTKHLVDNVSFKPAKDGKFVTDELKQVPLQSIYDRTGFWKVDRDLIAKNVKEGDLLSISAINSKNNSVVVSKADMSNTEFALMTVAQYNANNRRRTIDNVPGSVLMKDLFFKVDVFGSKLASDLESDFNPGLSEYISVVTGEKFATVIGDTSAEQQAKLAGLIAYRESNYMDSYIGTIIPNVYSSLNENVGLNTVFNADARLHGMVLTLNEDLLDDWSIEMDNGDATNILAFFKGFEDTPTGKPVSYQVVDVTGAVTTMDQFVDNTVATQNKILDLVLSRGIKAGLHAYKTNEFRYVLDSFKSYIQPEDKWQMGKLAEESKRFAFLYSTPFIKDFAKLPTYQDNNGVFDSKYILQGGNPNVQDKVLYSMPGPNNGDIATFPFAGGLIYDDGGTQVTLPGSVAGAIAYGAKHLSALRKPYSIVNGPVNGLVNMAYIVGVDYPFTDYDLDQLEPYGWNCIVKNGAVFEIRNDATAKNVVKSALSYASNYELITYIAREGRIVMEALLGERNNDTTRLRCKQGLDAITNKLLAEGAIESAQNVCDLTNNPANVQEQGFLIGDTIIVTAQGIRIALHRITVKLQSDATGLTN